MDRLKDGITIRLGTKFYRNCGLMIWYQFFFTHSKRYEFEVNFSRLLLLAKEIVSVYLTEYHPDVLVSEHTRRVVCLAVLVLIVVLKLY